MAFADLIGGPDDEADIDDTGENALADNLPDESLVPAGNHAFAR